MVDFNRVTTCLCVVSSVSNVLFGAAAFSAVAILSRVKKLRRPEDLIIESSIVDFIKPTYPAPAQPSGHPASQQAPSIPGHA